jgi:hypothetical protein
MEISAIQCEFVQWWDLSLDLILLMEVCNFPLLWTGTGFLGDAIDLQTYGYMKFMAQRDTRFPLVGIS